MTSRFRLPLLALLLAVTALQPLNYGTVAGDAVQQANCQTFSQTGKRVCDRFLAYWREHGGLAQQGYPISSVFNEVSEIDGKRYAVQYFERAVFEYHPENRPPYDVLLSLLGSTRYREKYPRGAPNQRPNTSPGSVLFNETGKRVGGVFLEYWRANGGLMQQGYPISDEFTEKSDLNGKEYTVQYFERAVFEHHPENRLPYNVLLSQLGTLQFERKYPNGEPGAATPTPSDPVAQLRQRPLRLPTLRQGEPCPVVPGRVVAPDFGPALGNGPVYPTGLGAEGVVQLDAASAEGGWFYVKVLWIGDPAYKGPALVRGGRIDSPGELRFEQGADPARELVLRPGPEHTHPSGWHHWPTYTRLRGPGCYAYQVDGLTFSEMIVFRAAR